MLRLKENSTICSINFYLQYIKSSFVAVKTNMGLVELFNVNENVEASFCKEFSSKTLKLQGISWLKVYILIDLLPLVKEAKLSVSTYKCNGLEPFLEYTKYSKNVKKTNKSENDHCNFEFSKSGKIRCRWKKLSFNNCSKFNLTEKLTTSCDNLNPIQSGLKFLHEKYFIAFQPDCNKMKPSITYIVSPLLERTSSSILLSFYYQMIGESSIKGYIVGKNYDTDFIENYASVLFEVKNTTKSKWTEKQVKLFILPRYSKYHVS